MRIGLIAPPWIPVPPPAYGGTEVVIDNLARGLAARGHDVRLFTVGESTSPVTRLHHFDAAVEPMNMTAPELAHVVAGYEALTDVDVIHDHTLAGPLVVDAHPRDVPLVVTHHGPFSADLRSVFAIAARHAAVVAISHRQARDAGDVPVAAVIHHGIDTDVYVAGAGGGGYLLFLGRMAEDKGAHRAVRVARRAGRRLVLVTKMRDDAERSYFEEEVRPILGRDDELLVEPDAATRLDLLGRADALLNPISWPEPFGLVMAESLASGTPVLTFPDGAAPEIVDDGVTGFHCEDEDAMVAAVDRVHLLDRSRCRAAAEERFSLARMAADHERLYDALVLADGLEPARASRRARAARTRSTA